MRIRLIIAALLFTTISAQAGILRTGLKAALDKGLIKITATSTGASYHDKALRLNLINQTADNIQLTVEPALIFQPTDTSFQDLVLPGNEMLVLMSGSSGELTVHTFCGKAHARAPGAELVYAFKKQGDTVMIQVAKYITSHHINDGLGQAAIWALTDHHNLQGIIDDVQSKESADLLALMAGLTGWEVPEYFKIYKLSTVEGQPVFQQRVLKILADFEWKVAESTNLRMGVYNEGGEEVQPVFFKEFKRGGYRLRVQFEAENARPGKYYIRLLDAGSTIREKAVVVD